MVRRRFVLATGTLLFLLGLFAGSLVYHFTSQTAQAQLVDVDEEEATEEQRDRLFELLEQDVAALEAHGALLRKVVKLVSPTVVHIEAEKEDSTAPTVGRSRVIEEAGSGVIYSEGGSHYVLTNRHVIRDAELGNIHINLTDGRQLSPLQIWTDADTDIAVMSVPSEGLIPARIGDSETVDIGDFVLAVGSPFGLTHSVTFGIISAKGRRDLELGDDGVRFQDFMQTDAAINPGNSGGPLMNLRGEVIGINTAIASSSGGNEGIGFSIPINMVMAVARQLVARGSVARAYLGVSLDRKFSSAMAVQLGLPRLQGARITGITPDSPAEAAGLQIGDVILTFNGIRVEDDAHLVNIVSLTEVEKEVPVVLFRERERQTIQVKVGDRSVFDARSFVPPEHDPTDDLGLLELDGWEFAELGLTVAHLDEATAEQLDLSGNVLGLLVTDVHPFGLAAGRIEAGEIIDRVDQAPVSEVADLEECLADDSWTERGVRLHVVPGVSGRHVPRTLVLRPDGEKSAP